MKIIEFYGKPEIITIDLQVIFGSPSRTCAGNGVCKMLPANLSAIKSLQCIMWLGKLSRLRNGDLKLSLPLSQFSRAAREKWLSAGKFTIEEQFDIPGWVGRKLKCGLLSLPVGNYDLQVNDIVYITFPKAKLVETDLIKKEKIKIANIL